MAKIVTDKYGVSKSTATPKVSTTTKSGISGVSVGEIKGSQKPAATAPVATATKTTTATVAKPNYQSVNGKIVDVNKTPAPPPEKKSFVIGSADDPAVQSGSMKQNPEGDAALGLIQEGFDKTKKTADKYGIGKVYSSIDEQVADTIAANKEKADLQKKVLEEQSAANKFATKNQINNISSSADTAASALRGSREGFNSESNIVAGKNIKASANAQIGRLQSARDTAHAQIEQAQKDLERANVAGNTELAKSLRNTIAAAELKVQETEAQIAESQQKGMEGAVSLLKDLSNAGALAGLSDDDIAYLQEQLPDAPPGVIQLLSRANTQKSTADAAKAKLDAAVTGIDTLGKIFDSGSQMSLDQVLSLSGSLGISKEDAIGLYQSRSATRNDKSLTEEEKQIKNAGALEDLKQKQRGEFTQASQNMAYLTKMIQDGRSPEDIAAFKSAAGITDENDPMRIADINYKRAQLDYTESQTAENYAAMKKAEREYLDMQPGSGGGGASGGYYIPNKSLEGITSEWRDGKLQINSKTPYQCGAFVNRFWGLGSGGKGGMGSSIGEKTALVEENGIKRGALTLDNFTQQIKPGMAFVTSYAGTGHTGIVTAVYPDGTYDTMEANIGDKNPNTPDPARPGHRSIKDGNLVGFARPPEGKASLNETRSDSYNDFVEQKMNEGMSKKDAQDLANKREEEKLKAGNKEQTSIDPISIAQNIMAPGSNFNLADIKQEDRPAVAAELNRLKKEALATGDIYGAIKASAGGKDLGETARNKLDQVTFGWDQFQDLEKEVDGMFSGPITGAIRNANVWDDKKAILTARLKAIVPSLARGVYNEVGVLTESDIENYMQTLPSTYTLESVKSDLINLTKNNIKNSLVNQLRNAAAGGADVSGYDYILDDLGIESTAKKQQKLNMIQDFAHMLVGDTQQNNGKLMLPEDIAGGTFDENYIDNTF